MTSHIPKKALFLDRDGVINHDKGYVFSWDDIEFYDGIYKLLRAARLHGYVAFVITNQSGIAREYFSQEQFTILTIKMLKHFKAYGCEICAVYFCPYLNDAESDNMWLRKPNPGMFEAACVDFNIDLSSSIFIGDRFTDLQAAHAAKVANIFIFKNGSNAIEIKKCDEAKGLEFSFIDSLDDVRNWISGNND
ncbi:HAD family hydrolase [Planktomarina temperata]|nr:HAD family hydrolase [Planktomarina temperata]